MHIFSKRGNLQCVFFHCRDLESKSKCTANLLKLFHDGARCAVLTLMGIDGVLGSPALFVLVVLPLRCCFECLHSPRVPTLGKSPFSPHEGFWCRRSTALSSSWVSNLGESTVKETNRSFDRSRSKFADPRYRPRGRITKPVTVTTAYNRTILSGTAASAQYKMAKAALHLNAKFNAGIMCDTLMISHDRTADQSHEYLGL